MSPNMFGRPDDPINETPTTISSPNAPNVSVAYPTFNDWLGLYDFHKTLNGGDAAKRVLFNDMKRGHEHTVLELLNLVSKQSTGRSVLVEIMTVPAISVLNLAASRPFNGSSMILADSTTSAKVEVLVSTCTVWPATVTVSVTAPTSMGMVMVMLWLASKTTSVCR